MTTATRTISQTDIGRIDSAGMFDLLKAFPQHWSQGFELSRSLDSGVQRSDIDHVLVSGMGGSAIGGDLVRAFSLEQSPVPVSVWRGYELPAFAASRSLVIVSSYSGNTEETLSCLKEALDRKCHIICVSSGGEVIDIARTRSLPSVEIPGGMPPRAALAYSFSVLLNIASKVGLVQLDENDVVTCGKSLETGAAEYANIHGNEALNIANEIGGNLPVIYSGGGFLEAVNLRWRGQIQENAKVLAIGNLYPEMNHNEIMGWMKTAWLTERAAVITLRDRDDHPRIARRMDVIRELLKKRSGRWIEIESRGQSKLERLLSLVQLGDWVSFYLAILNGTDPTPISLIDAMKSRL